MGNILVCVSSQMCVNTWCNVNVIGQKVVGLHEMK